jgi:general secretion pathway protein B
VSILLEALRKSEKSQRSREVPTIHTEVPSGDSSGSSKVVPVSLLVIIALIICGWFVWNQYGSAEDSEQVVADETQAAGPEAQDSSGVAQQNIKASDSSRIPASVQLSVDDEALAEMSPETGKRPESTQSRTPMETYQTPPQSASSTIKPEAVVRSGVSIAGPESTDNRASPNSAANANPAAADSATSTAESEAYRPQEPAALGYWDLPDSVRADVPEITFSVLVYAKNPADRFVLINGERLAEGDNHQPELVIKEIRRDGVLFSYRLYEFLVEK